MDTTSNLQNNDSDKAPLVLVVLLNWNSHEETRTAAASVLGMDYPNLRILIIDNGSKGDSVSELRKLVGDTVDLLESPTNTGYTGGCNLGMQRALDMGAKYVWLLNNDAIAERGTLSSIVAVAESNPKIGLVTPLIAPLEGERLTFAGGVISIKDSVYEDTHDLAVAAEWAIKYPDAGLVIGTAMLVPTEVIRRIGMLDPAFFAYYEDTDYSARSAQAGFRNVVDPNSVVKHYEKNYYFRPYEIKPHYWYYMARNESRFWRKHLGLRGSLRRTWLSFHRFLRSHNRLGAVMPEERRAILAGLWDGWCNRGGPYRPEAHMPAPVAVLVRIYSHRAGLQPQHSPINNAVTGA
jgi:GT2 family glycosyltransferase